MDISISEIQNFLRCRRMWDFASPNRQALVRRGAPDTALHIGTVVHEAFDLQVKHPDSWREHLTAFLSDLEHEIKSDYRDMVGASLGPEELELLDESRNIAGGVVENYFQRYTEDAPLGANMTYKQTEISFRIKIPNTRNHLIGTLDGIASAEDDSTHPLWIVEHKTYSQRSTYENLLTNIQMIGYMWASTMLFGDRVQGILYDGVSKKVPVVPAVLKSGALSKAKMDTTPEIYRQALSDNHLDVEDYQEFLIELEERIYSDKSPFWTRHELRIPRSAIVRFETDLQDISRDMAKKKLKLYPNMPWMGCWDCRVRPLCDAVQFDEDVEGLASDMYTKGKPYRTIKAQEMEAIAAGVLGI